MSSTDCAAVRRELHDTLRGRHSPEAQRRLLAHLATCAECRALHERERELDAALGRLPEHPPAPGLEQRLLASIGSSSASSATPPVSRVSAAPPPRAPAARGPAWARTWAAVGAAVAVAATVLVLVLVPRNGGSSEAMVAEAVNDHLRVLYAAQPIEIESGGIHQVKPWFSGRVDFAPRLGFEGDADFSLSGGSVGYFIDRKAAVFVFKHRLHVITLFEFRAEGLPWRGDNLTLGSVKALQAQARGFQVVTFRDGDLGYALVSDVDPGTLAQFASRIVSGL